MKIISFDGRIGKEITISTTPKTGRKYIKFSVANNSFAQGKETTEWFDVVSYDPYIIDKRSQYLTKGTYVIINGTLTTEVNVKNGKVYLNNYVNASNIETPKLSKKSDEPDIQRSEVENSGLSTYTASTVAENSIIKKETPTPAPAPSYAAAIGSYDDELPF